MRKFQARTQPSRIRPRRQRRRAAIRVPPRVGDNLETGSNPSHSVGTDPPRIATELTELLTVTGLRVFPVWCLCKSAKRDGRMAVGFEFDLRVDPAAAQTRQAHTQRHNCAARARPLFGVRGARPSSPCARTHRQAPTGELSDNHAEPPTQQPRRQFRALPHSLAQPAQASNAQPPSCLRNGRAGLLGDFEGASFEPQQRQGPPRPNPTRPNRQPTPTAESLAHCPRRKGACPSRLQIEDSKTGRGILPFLR